MVLPGSVAVLEDQGRSSRELLWLPVLVWFEGDRPYSQQRLPFVGFLTVVCTPGNVLKNHPEAVFSADVHAPIKPLKLAMLVSMPAGHLVSL